MACGHPERQWPSRQPVPVPRAPRALAQRPAAMSSTTRMDGAGGDLRCAITKWNVIYPVYLNSKKTVAEGCRIATAKACLYTTYVEITDCCKHLQIPHVIDYASFYSHARTIFCSCKQGTVLPMTPTSTGLEVRSVVCSNHSSQPEECLLAFLQSQNASATVGHWLSLLLQTSELEASRGHRGSADVRKEALHTLRILISKVLLHLQALQLSCQEDREQQ